ncbi:hypothetical protein [Lutibacter sp.]
MNPTKTILISLIIGGSIGFKVSQNYFPKFDYGYTKEGGNIIVKEFNIKR